MRNGESRVEAADESRRSRASLVYPALVLHQCNEQWAGRDALNFLHEWAVRFNVQFKLNVPEFVLCLDRLPSKQLGHFRYGHNSFGLRGEIAINSRYVSADREPWELLGVVLHALIHGWQQETGKRRDVHHHDAAFRQKARELGLVVERNGVTGYAAESPFKDLLRQLGIAVPDGEVKPVQIKPAVGSKLVKWTCKCGTNVRVAIEDFRALCLKCNSEFVRENVERETRINRRFPPFPPRWKSK